MRFWHCLLLAGVWLAWAGCPADAGSREKLIFVRASDGFCTGADVRDGSLDATHFELDFKSLPNLLPHDCGLAGMAAMAATDGGVLAYNKSTGATIMFNLDQWDFLQGETGPLFTTGWTRMFSQGNFVYLYDGGSNAALGYVAPDLTFHQTASVTGLSPWTHIISTDNHIFYYNRGSGVQAVGAIVGADSHLDQSSSGKTSSGYNMVVGHEDGLVLYNSATGGYETGIIAMVGGGQQDIYRKMAVGKLPTSYGRAAWIGDQLALYSSASGKVDFYKLTIGHALQKVTTVTVGAGMTDIVAGHSWLFCYNAKTDKYVLLTLVNGILVTAGFGSAGLPGSRVISTQQ